MFSPAPGFRSDDEGVLSSVGNNGASWSSSIIGDSSIHLGFGAIWFYSNGVPHRAYGFQLRCLSE
ncbi:hypothetical protein [uncultured Rikenella sp.]|uniref:hypothetical protein n=1 Tax=uncultured Rikenella sp. TaxID=368003 RepID=UPI0025CCDC8F|nr:hypothetical protein [uncultured Rikenella sp.]